ncbi:angiotensin-converting enzyme-like isoform X2 [Maniola hyperantus]|uniref:angiotensin-converting enzyme-like isoform X2 n=1 Tax=Aphantopus hyperantus TaxID=2795564 RepID=UPI001569D3F0|nr:angiotensin-converting enzyme-like isoform X1 [Maniola hyperantus]
MLTRGRVISNMILIEKLICITIFITAITAVQFPNHPTSEMSASADVKFFVKSNKTTEQSDESGHEIETEIEEKKFLDDALKTVLDPRTVIGKVDEVVENFKIQLEEVDKENSTIELFMEEMDKLSLEICKTSQESLWDYVTDINSEVKKNKMVRIAAEEDEIKKQYWTILKKKYMNDQEPMLDLKLKRKIRIIKERGTNVQTPQSKQREEIDTMQRIWSRVSVCAYNASVCNDEDSQRTMNDIITVFKTSNDTDELAYYWKAYRDATGKKIRPIFKDYVNRMNNVAVSENFTDAGEMWRYVFEDDDFMNTVNRLWNEIKPFYNLLHSYVRAKLKAYYKKELKDDESIPAHILGNLWAQEWQAIYHKVAAYPNIERATVLQNESIHFKDLFNAVDEFHQSLGFESAKDTFADIKETVTSVNCLPSSHDMCDGVNYKIKWCGEKVSDVTVGLSRAARLLGHVQYFKHYRNLQPLYRDGPNPAFHDAISDIAAVQLTSPKHLQTLNFVKVESTAESTLNHLLWLALEKFPLMAYAYVLDKWRWDVFANSTMEDWNQYWWDLRTRETGISPPMDRNESDLDPAAKYHVVSHVQYITYLISHILEFQILLSLCKRANHTGPLHECSIYGDKEAGKMLSDGMSLGASEDWRTVLHAMTGETELSTKGILEYFAALKDFLKEETAKLERKNAEMDTNAPIIIGIVAVLITLLMFILYCVKNRDSVIKILSYCSLSKNGSLDIVTNELSQRKPNDVDDGVCEDKL